MIVCHWHEYMEDSESRNYLTVSYIILQGNSTKKEQSYYQVLLGQLDSHMLNDEFKHFPHIIQKNIKHKVQWIIELNIRANTMNILEEYIGKESS